MILTTASSIYGAVTGWRRQWYARDPSRQRRLSRPVVSVGNLRAGGAGKTPLVAALAQLLVAHGERPAILTRGYARRVSPDGVTVVSDARGVLAGVDTAGDEALMLARALPGVPVLVSPDRYLAGCLAEHQLGATLHLLDDGFQHAALARDVDLLVVDAEDLTDRVLPAGRLREPRSAASRADALLTTESDPATRDRLRDALRVARTFRVTRTLGAPRVVSRVRLKADTTNTDTTFAAPVFAVAGVARPQRFFDDLRAAGWQVMGTTAFRDHHRFSAADMRRIDEAARAAGAGLVLTTEKDAVRMEVHDANGVPIAAVPLTATIEPAFTDWLLDRVHHRNVSTRDASA